MKKDDLVYHVTLDFTNGVPVIEAGNITTQVKDRDHNRRAWRIRLDNGKIQEAAEHDLFTTRTAAVVELRSRCRQKIMLLVDAIVTAE